MVNDLGSGTQGKSPVKAVHRIKGQTMLFLVGGILGAVPFIIHRLVDPCVPIIKVTPFSWIVNN